MSATRMTTDNNARWVARRKEGSLYAEVFVADTPACIAEVYNHEPGAMHNARLIAAAPALLEALKAFVQFADDMGRDGVFTQQMAAARTAIAAAVSQND